MPIRDGNFWFEGGGGTRTSGQFENLVQLWELGTTVEGPLVMSGIANFDPGGVLENPMETLVQPEELETAAEDPMLVSGSSNFDP